MPPSAESRAREFFDRLGRPAQTTVLLIMVGLILFLALALDSGGETAFMYVTF